MCHSSLKPKAPGDCSTLRSSLSASQRCLRALHADRPDAPGRGLVRELLKSLDVASEASRCKDLCWEEGRVRKRAEEEVFRRVGASWQDAVRRVCGQLPPVGWEEEMATLREEVEESRASIRDLSTTTDAASRSLEAALEELGRERDVRGRLETELRRQVEQREREGTARRERDTQLKQMVDLTRRMEAARAKSACLPPFLFFYIFLFQFFSASVLFFSPVHLALFLFLPTSRAPRPTLPFQEAPRLLQLRRSVPNNLPCALSSSFPPQGRCKPRNLRGGACRSEINGGWPRTGVSPHPRFRPPTDPPRSPAARISAGESSFFSLSFPRPPYFARVTMLEGQCAAFELALRVEQCSRGEGRAALQAGHRPSPGEVRRPGHRPQARGAEKAVRPRTAPNGPSAARSQLATDGEEAKRHAPVDVEKEETSLHPASPAGRMSSHGGGAPGWHDHKSDVGRRARQIGLSTTAVRARGLWDCVPEGRGKAGRSGREVKAL